MYAHGTVLTILMTRFTFQNVNMNKMSTKYIIKSDLVSAFALDLDTGCPKMKIGAKNKENLGNT